jgi:SET domain
MYCSPHCQAEHHKAIHSAECCKKPLPIVLIVCAKMIFIAKSIAGSFKKLCNLINDTKPMTIFDCDLSDPTIPSYRKNLLKVLNSCAMSENSKIVITDNMKTMFNHSLFASIWETPEERELLIEIFHKQLRIHNTNKLEMGQHILEITPKEKCWYVKSIGGGLCPFASLFNHSCDANVKRFTVENKLVFVVGQPIKAGEQLFISYGCSSYRVGRKDRHKELTVFGFTCDCLACVKNYPPLPKLPKFDYNFDEPEFKAFSVKKAVIQFRKNCEYIEKNFFEHPSFETTTVINHNEHLLHQISKVTFDEN